MMATERELTTHTYKRWYEQMEALLAELRTVERNRFATIQGEVEFDPTEDVRDVRRKRMAEAGLRGVEHEMEKMEHQHPWLAEVKGDLQGYDDGDE
jgi:hypothetical protein